ncbi:MAG: amidase, partial [Rhodospirillaceae bacterium]|nr:amidase [Rhodospirillaceae bacterium]
SSGAAVSLWEGSCRVAFGTDTRGSVRIPGAMSGVVGLKITAGRWSDDGIVPLDPEHDTPGPLTLSVQDSAYVFAALDPAHVRNPQGLLNNLEQSRLSDFRIGIADACFWGGCSPGVAEAAKAALSELEAAGAQLGDADSPESRDLEEVFMRGRLLMPDLFAFIETELPEWAEQLEPRLQKGAERMQRLLATDHIKRKLWVRSLAETADRCFANIDVIACPTVPRTPPVLVDGAPVFADDDPPEHICARNTCLVNFFGWCAITLPVGLDQLGMPVGLQLMAPGGHEETLLAVASAAERTFGDVRSRLGTPPLLG